MKKQEKKRPEAPRSGKPTPTFSATPTGRGSVIIAIETPDLIYDTLKVSAAFHEDGNMEALLRNLLLTAIQGDLENAARSFDKMEFTAMAAKGYTNGKAGHDRR